MNYNGKTIETIEELEIEISSLDENNKAYMRALFNGTEYVMSFNPIVEEVKRMEKRRIDGIARFQITQAELRLTRLAETTPSSVFNDLVYLPLATVINNINTGNWLDAFENIKKVQTNETLSATMLLRFKKNIAHYLVGDGDYQEFKGKTVNSTTGEIE
jgi:hypothetical protein